MIFDDESGLEAAYPGLYEMTDEEVEEFVTERAAAMAERAAARAKLAVPELAAKEWPQLFVCEEGRLYLRRDAERALCPCCGKSLEGSPLPRWPKEEEAEP